MAIVVFKEDEDQSNPQWDIEGLKILSGLPTISTAFIMLLRFLYTLNLQYHK